MITYNEAIYINKRKVTTYVMKAGGGLSASLPHLLLMKHLCTSVNAIGTYTLEKAILEKKREGACTGQMHVISKEFYHILMCSKQSSIKQIESDGSIIVSKLFKHCVSPQGKRFSSQ